MSRVGTQTDNPFIESIYGWIKAKIRCDYTHIKKINIPVFLDKYVEYYNIKRPVYALDYFSPVQYRIEHGLFSVFKTAHIDFTTLLSRWSFFLDTLL